MVGDELYEYAGRVTSRKDFIQFVNYLNDDYRQKNDEWGNKTLEEFLRGLAAFANDMSGYYKNMGNDVDVESITWRMAAQMLLAASVYGT